MKSMLHETTVVRQHTMEIEYGFYYILTKRGKKRSCADVGLIFDAYNLKRIMNILDKNIFKKFLQELGFLFIGKLFDGNENAINK